MRLLIAMMKHETNTFSPVPTPLARFGPLYSDAAIRAYRGTGTGLGKVKIGADRGAGAAERRDRGVAGDRAAAAPEPAERRRHRRERVGLVLHHGDQEPHRADTPSRTTRR